MTRNPFPSTAKCVKSESIQSRRQCALIAPRAAIREGQRWAWTGREIVMRFDFRVAYAKTLSVVGRSENRIGFCLIQPAAAADSSERTLPVCRRRGSWPECRLPFHLAPNARGVSSRHWVCCWCFYSASTVGLSSALASAESENLMDRRQPWTERSLSARRISGHYLARTAPFLAAKRASSGVGRRVSPRRLTGARRALPLVESR